MISSKAEAVKSWGSLVKRLTGEKDDGSQKVHIRVTTVSNISWVRRKSRTFPHLFYDVLGVPR